MKRGFTCSSRLFVVATVALAVGLLTAPGASGDGGDLLWTDQFDLAGGLDEGFSLAVGGGRVFAGGGGHERRRQR